jgi:hypothetical protein
MIEFLDKKIFFHIHCNQAHFWKLGQNLLTLHTE